MAIQQMLLSSYGGGGSAGYQAETIAWASGIVTAGGSVTTQEKDWADALIVAIRAATFNSKIIWLAPFIGTNVKAHRQPLRDTLARGQMNSYGSSPFVDADCTNSGIANPTEKNAYLGTGLAVNFNSANSNAVGMGFYERSWGAGTNVEPMGCYNSGGTERYVIDLRSTLQRFRFGGATTSQAGPGTTASSGHYYGQRSSSTLRQIYKDGASLGSDGTTFDAASGIDGSELFVMGVNANTDAPWKGRCACAYITDGTMTSTEIASLHTLLGTYLITPTGR